MNLTQICSSFSQRESTFVLPVRLHKTLLLYSFILRKLSVALLIVGFSLRLADINNMLIYCYTLENNPVHAQCVVPYVSVLYTQCHLDSSGRNPIHCPRVIYPNTLGENKSTEHTFASFCVFDWWWRQKKNRTRGPYSATLMQLLSFSYCVFRFASVRTNTNLSNYST